MELYADQHGTVLCTKHMVEAAMDHNRRTKGDMRLAEWRQVFGFDLLHDAEEECRECELLVAQARLEVC